VSKPAQVRRQALKQARDSKPPPGWMLLVMLYSNQMPLLAH